MTKELENIIIKHNNIQNLVINIDYIVKTINMVFKNESYDDLSYLMPIIDMLRHETSSLVNISDSFHTKLLKQKLKAENKY